MPGSLSYSLHHFTRRQGTGNKCCHPNKHYGSVGFDTSSPVTAAQAECLKGDAGMNFASVRAWLSSDGFDDNAPATMATLQAVGMFFVDVYISPCGTHDPAAQAAGLVSALTAHGSTWNRTIIRVEDNDSPGCEWPTDVFTNCRFLEKMVHSLQMQGLDVGIYSSSDVWGRIMGGCGSVAFLPLWNAEPNGSRSCEDRMKPYGGWFHAEWKQYGQKDSSCNVDHWSNVVCAWPSHAVL